MADTAASPSDSELRAQVERALGAHYELDCEIGRGGMGVVYRARDCRLKRIVAIKVLPPELAFRREIKTRFLREAETAAQLNHANIVDIYSVDETDTFVYFAMAYIRGENLARRLHENGPLDIDETRRILRDVADALAYAHDRGVIHRDIKPDNIVIDGDTGRPMVTDFGLARAITDMESRLTLTGIAIGTPTYMSPEQASGDRETDGRSDLYSLGVVAYQMLAGEPPFTARSAPALLVKHISELPVPVDERRPDVPPDLARVVMRLLEKDPASRYENAAALVGALDGISESGARRAARAPRPFKRTSANPLPVSRSHDRAARGTSSGGSPITLDEIERWRTPVVRAFRAKFAAYVFVNVVVMLAALFTSWSAIIWWTVGHSIFMAVQYVKLRDDDYDWRDVFRQPHDRNAGEFVADTLAAILNLVNPRARAARRRAKIAAADARRHGGGRSEDHAGQGGITEAHATYDRWITRAVADRDEIARILDGMDPMQRSIYDDVGRSADALAARMQALHTSLADLKDVDAPLMEEHRAAMSANLDSCGSLLESMKFGLRLATGRQAQTHVQSLATEALSLAASVDGTLAMTDEMARLSGTGTTATTGAARPQSPRR